MKPVKSSERTCRHNFEFLRQEQESNGGHRPSTTVYDVFFCRACLRYTKVAVKQLEYGERNLK